MAKLRRVEVMKILLNTRELELLNRAALAQGEPRGTWGRRVLVATARRQTATRQRAPASAGAAQ